MVAAVTAAGRGVAGPWLHLVLAGEGRTLWGLALPPSSFFILFSLFILFYSLYFILFFILGQDLC